MRVFTALPIPAGATSPLSRAAGILKRRYDHLKVIKPGGLHITLIFFGELSAEQAARIMALMDEPSLRGARIKASLGSLGCFPARGNTRVIFVDINEGRDEIAAFYHKFAALIRKLDERYTKEDKDFIPHITLARNKRGRIELAGFKDLPGSSRTFTIDRLVLFESILKPGGTEYHPLKTVMFQ